MSFPINVAASSRLRVTRRSPRVGFVALLLGLCAVSVLAQSPDRWYVTLQYDQVSTDASGGGASLEWHRPLTRDRHLLAGAFAFTLSDTHWQYARLGYVTPLPGQLTASIGADLGTGTADEHGFDYRIVRAALRRPFSSRYAAEAEAQHLLVDTARGTMLKGAVHCFFGPVEASLGYHTSVSGNLDAQFVSGRIDVLRGTRKVFGGFASGRSQPDVRQLAISPQASQSLEMFAGFTATPRITLVLNAVEFEQVTRYSALVSWKSRP